MPIRHQSAATPTKLGRSSSQLATLLACGVVVFASMGASCSPRLGSPFGIAGPPAPVLLSPTATAAEIVTVVNANASRIQSYQAQSATISMPQSAGLPLVKASLAAERPLRFRLRATTAITGPEIDLGSNDDRFWIWARRNEPPAVYTARHDQWAASPMRGQVAIEPAWLIDAIGLVQLDPNAAYIGPLPRGDGTVELRTEINGPAGPQQRAYIIDSQSGWVREQHVYDAAGSLTASVFADRFQYDAATQISLPERARLNLPAAGLDLTINTGPIVTNAPLSDGGQLWTMPQLGNAPTIDLTGGTTGAGPESPWDLTGTSDVYGQPKPVIKQFADTAPPTAGWRSAQADPAPSAAAVPPAVAKTPTTYPATGTPLPPTQSSAGFVGLPSNGRIIER